MKPERAQVLTQGLIAGFIGYAAVVVFFAALNLIGGRSAFYTAAALGSSLFYGLQDPSLLTIAPGPVLAYNGVHLLLSLLIGTIGAWLIFEIERHHFLWYFVGFIFLAGFIYGLVAIGIVSAEIAQVLPWWTVLTANLIWVGSLGLYLWFQHRGLLATIKHEEELSP